MITKNENGFGWGSLLLAVLFFWTQSRMLNLMLLGDESALTLGTDLHIYRQIYLLVSSLIVGFVVYAAGMVGFVGLVVPHVIRMLVGTDHKKLIPVSALTGAVFLVISSSTAGLDAGGVGINANATKPRINHPKLIILAVLL